MERTKALKVASEITNLIEQAAGDSVFNETATLIQTAIDETSRPLVEALELIKSGDCVSWNVADKALKQYNGR